MLLLGTAYLLRETGGHFSCRKKGTDDTLFTYISYLDGDSADHRSMNHLVVFSAVLTLLSAAAAKMPLEGLAPIIMIHPLSLLLFDGIKVD